ncbi:MAG: hypothetical protein M3004_00490 [Bacteroidota bacterium]|nr:hypothetical protein [Bacteroidota bacterium]
MKVICYYPGGMMMPGRQFTQSSSKYRYGFNSQEKDDEIKGEGNSYTAQFWEYDPRLVRRWNLDTKASSFPWQSPYSVFDNNPILKNDPTGESGIVTIDKANKTVTVTSTLTLYGDGASSALAKQSASLVQNQWNAAKGTTKINGVEYQVKFIVIPQYMDVKEQGGLVGNALENTIKHNNDYSQNYMQVVRTGIPVSGLEPIPIGATPGGNTGRWLLSDISDGNSTTASHEMGHGWGELLTTDGGDDRGHPENNDLRGKGQPSIMYPRGTLVDAKYTRDQKLGNSKIVDGNRINTLDPSKRKVTQKDIDNLHLDKLKFDKNGKANLGNLQISIINEKVISYYYFNSNFVLPPVEANSK